MIIAKAITTFILAVFSLITTIYFAIYFVNKAKRIKESVIFCMVVFNLSAATVFFIVTGVLILEGILK